MNLCELFPKSALDEQMLLKMVKSTPHPTLRLAILNYTQQATFMPEHWNYVTDLCRGIVYNLDTLEVVARPFAKFWNYGDTRHPETLPENIPAEEPIVTRKMDGSLGIAYPTPKGWAVATRGSFASDQATWATKWLDSHPMKCTVGEYEDPYTALFEIVYPENQIVVRYPFAGLVLLALVRIRTGEEAPRETLEQFAVANGYDVVPAFDKPVDSLACEDTQNEEGYVVAWSRPGKSPLRVKIKYATYCRLHKLLTGTNAIDVWKMLRDGLDTASLTVDVPEEFKVWLAAVEYRLMVEYHRIEAAAWASWHAYNGPDPKVDRKAFALYATQQGQSAPILFAILDGKKFDTTIWKMLRPRGDERTFKQAEE